MNYYNDNDKSCCAWLRELIKDGLIPEGDVDGRSITEVRAEDLRSYDQCHFFAGIGGWSLALKLAGWEDKAWTGSCPCQPFSTAGKGKGEADERHLWPAFFKLIKECHPGTVFGEQVAAAIAYGWLDGVFADLEGEDYSCGAAVLGAHSVGAPHIRQRLYWVAHSESGRRQGEIGDIPEKEPQSWSVLHQRIGCRSEVGRVADAERKQEHEEQQRPKVHEGGGSTDIAGGCDASGRLADRFKSGLEGHAGDGHEGDEPRRDREDTAGPASASRAPGWNGPCVWWPCRDGVRRRIPAESVFQFTFDGISGIMGAGWIEVVSKIKEVIYGKKANPDTDKALREVWCSVAKTSLQWNAGRQFEIQEPEILLLALCQLSRDTEPERVGPKKDFSFLREATMRILWFNASPSRSSYQRELERPGTGEPKNPLHSLSSWIAQQDGKEVRSLLQQVQEARDVSEAFPEVEKTWRSVFGEEAKVRDAARYKAGKGAIVATNCFPLAVNVPGRVGLLRGAGNAIVPPLAAEFVKAFMESS
jgi:DNA (cytosine-5)-methyltransferase 1